MSSHPAHTSPTDADYIRQQLSIAGLSQRGAARELGIDERTMRHYCSGNQPVPPVVSLALRHLAAIRLNDQCLHMIDDGKMTARDGIATVDRLVEANARLRAANKMLMRMLTENRPAEQKALLDWFHAREPTGDQLRGFAAALAKTNACPRCWLEPFVDEQTQRTRNRDQPTALAPDGSKLICPVCREQYAVDRL
jgi:hypothetical protein